LAEAGQGVLVFSLFNLYNLTMPKRTYQPKKLKRKRKHGYLALSKTRSGKNLIKRRRLKGRKRLAI